MSETGLKSFTIFGTLTCGTGWEEELAMLHTMSTTTNCRKPFTSSATTHPFHANFVAKDKSRGPYVDVFYQRATAAPANTTVQFTGLESVGAYERRVENDRVASDAADWHRHPLVFSGALRRLQYRCGLDGRRGCPRYGHQLVN